MNGPLVSWPTTKAHYVSVLPDTPAGGVLTSKHFTLVTFTVSATKGV